MNKRLLSTVFVISVTLLALSSPTLAVEKLKFGTPIKFAPAYYLPVLAAEEKGFWKENDLEVEWVPVSTTIAHHHAITAGSIRMGMDTGVGMVPGISRGVPAILVASVQNYLSSSLYVRVDSPVRETKELKKGARVGVVSLGGHDHAFGRVLLRPFGLERDVRFVALGGVLPTMAALKAGAVDASGMVLALMIPLEVKGDVRAIVRLQDYIKEPPYLGGVHWARRDFLRTNRETVVRTIKAVLQAQEFVNKNQRWAEEKMKSEQGVPERAAEELYKLVRFSEDGKITRERLEKARNFLVEYDLVPRDKLPPIEELYTGEVVG